MRSLKQYINEGMFADSIHEGMFDVEDAANDVQSYVHTENILKELGLEVLLEDDGVFYCESLKSTVKVNSKFLNQYPTNLDTLAVRNSIDIIVPLVNIKNVFTGEVRIKNTKISNTNFSGFGLNIINKKEVTQTSAFISGQTEIINCNFENIEELGFNPKKTRFKNVSIYNDDYPLNVYIVFPGSKKDVCDWMESKLPSLEKNPVANILKYFGIESKYDSGAAYVDIIPTIPEDSCWFTCQIWQSIDKNLVDWHPHTPATEKYVKRMIKKLS